MTPTPQNPCWTVADVTRDQHWLVRPDPRQEQDLARVLAASEQLPFDQLTVAHVPASTRELWARVAACLLRRYGFCVLQGLPTPPDPAAARRLCFLAGLGIGVPVFQDSAGGRLADIRGTGALEAAGDASAPRRGEGHYVPDESGTEFRLHTDPSDVAGLYCIRPAASGGTSSVVSALAVHERLKAHHPELLDALYEPIPYGQSNERGSTVHSLGLPVFGWRDGHFKCHVVPDLIDAGQRVPGVPRLSARQVAALAQLDAIARDPELALRYRLEPGDFLLTNNHLVLHGRDAYRDDAAQPRHLLRLWLALRDSPPLPEVHRAWIGDTAAGALRGGIVPERLRELLGDVTWPDYELA